MSSAPYTVFGVRHLSPGVAWHLRQVLDRQRPKVLLIEGPSDMDAMIDDMTHPECKPPIAALAYTTEIPVETLLYPFARYSPEYQALMWAKAHDAEVRFIDLPSSTFLALEIARRKRLLERMAEEESDASAPGNCALEETEADADIRLRIAELSGEMDYESYWEGRFEGLSEPTGYQDALRELGHAFRELEAPTGEGLAENLVREAYMRRRIQETLDAGTAPEDIIVIVGAFHAPVMTPDELPMSDAELERLPDVPANFTLMPYSYFKLSTQSGYGAGNQAPAYFELKWQCMAQGQFDRFPSIYLSQIARQLRDAGTFRSTAEVIEGVRLARALASLHERANPVRRELKDAAVTLLGQGVYLAVADALDAADSGDAIGTLPPGVSQTSIQDDFQRELKRLKLDRYYQGASQDLSLDLRENRRVSSEEAAFLDLNRSSFLNRIAVLSIPFAERMRSDQSSATWSEKWRLKWTPEAEIALVEAVLLGETVEVATAFALRQRLDAATSVEGAARVVRLAGDCALPTVMEQARLALRDIAATSSRFDDLAIAAAELARTVRYGDVRRFAVEPLMPLIEQLFRESALHLYGAANCDDDTAANYLVAINELDAVAIQFSDQVDEALWERELLRLSDSDAHNPMLSGFCCALLLERGLIGEDALSKELARRLSPGIAVDLGAGWFEGLSKRNRYALLSRLTLWQHLDEYIHSLDDDAFKRALVFLRRALDDFSAHERRQIAENLGELWGVHRDVAADLLERDLTDDEKGALDDLNDMDFGDL